MTGAVAEELVAVSCPSVGNCVATGAYRDGAMNQLGFVATESGGTWTAVPAPTPPGAAADPEVELSASPARRPAVAPPSASTRMRRDRRLAPS